MALPKLNTSKFLMTIPSTGQEVEYRPYLVKEEKILMMALETKDQAAIVRAVAQVIADCITEDIDIDKFAMYDVEYCFLQLRAKSSGEVIDLRLPCEIESCKHVNDFHVDISKIDVPKATKVEPIMLTSEVGVQMRYPGIKDIRVGEELETIEGATNMFAKLIVTIFEDDEIHNAADEPMEDKIAFINSLNSEQFRKLTEFLSNTPSIEHKADYTCAKCKHETKIELQGLQSFFT